jgi:hypothetical protein
MIVRPVESADYLRWLPLWEGYNAFYGRAGSTALADEVTQTTWSRFFDAGEPMHALVAESGAELIGLAHYLFHRSTTLVAPICYLQSLHRGGRAPPRGGRQADRGGLRAGARCRLRSHLLADP